jgi:hypothetical protein
VCAENSDSAIMVMKAAKNGARGDGTEAFNCPMKRGILVQTAMAPRCIVVGGKLAKGPAQMCLPEHDHVVEAFPSDRADQSLCVPVLPRGAWRNGFVANAHGAYPAGDNSTVNSVTVADQVAWRLIPGRSFGDLLRDPLCRWVPRDIDPDELPPSQPDNHQNVELHKADGRDHKQSIAAMRGAWLRMKVLQLWPEGPTLPAMYLATVD